MTQIMMRYINRDMYMYMCQWGMVHQGSLCGVVWKEQVEMITRRVVGLGQLFEGQ